MSVIDTDYLVVGAGASAMAFIDVLLTDTQVTVVLVDRRHRPGGHWLDAYPFVRLHQPSATYGVTSRSLGSDRIDDSGPNAGWYERATADEICAYYERLLCEWVAGGRVRFLPNTDYRGSSADGHHLVSLLTGDATTVRARRLVDATYVESEIPSRHPVPYDVADGVHVIAPNDLVDLSEAPSGFTVIGCGKTAMDTCNWLMDSGVDPDRVEWVRPRDPWLFNRAYMQPLELVGSYMQMQARWVAAAATAMDGRDFARQLEDTEVFLRIDRRVEPEVFRGATISQLELDQLASIEQVVRLGRVRDIGLERVTLDEGHIPADPKRVYIDCTAAGVRATLPRPIFEPGGITLQYTTIGIVPLSAATIATIEVTHEDDAEKNQLCPVVQFTGDIADGPRVAYQGMLGIAARRGSPSVAAWWDRCRLNPASAAIEHADDPDVASAFTSILNNVVPALNNLGQLVGAMS